MPPASQLVFSLIKLFPEVSLTKPREKDSFKVRLRVCKKHKTQLRTGWHYYANSTDLSIVNEVDHLWSEVDKIY